MAGHARWERMAVGHVLGGLDDVDAGAFREHLVGCRDCRRQVHELRDIASSLSAAERDERARAAAGTTEVRTRAEEQAPPEVVDVAPWRTWPWGTVVIVLVPLFVLVVLAWAVWLRAENELLQGVATSQQQVLDVLADGDEVAWSAAGGASGDVAVLDDLLAVNLRGVPGLQPDEAVVVWLLDDSGTTVRSSRPFLASQVAGGSLVLVLDGARPASEVVVSVERAAEIGELPAGGRIMSGALPGRGATPAATGASATG